MFNAILLSSALALSSTQAVEVTPPDAQLLGRRTAWESGATQGTSAMGANFRARTSDAGLFVQLDGTVPVLPEVSIRLEGVGRGDVSSRRPESVSPTSVGDRIEYAWGAVRERFDAHAGGIAQSFEFDEEPGGAGDLVLEIQIDGPFLVEERIVPSVGALDLFSFGRPAVRYGQALAYDAAGVSIPVASSTVPRGTSRSIRLHVPGHVLESASYPLVVDPAITPITTIDPSAMGTSSAYDPTRERYLLAWSEGAEVKCQLFDREGVALGAEATLDAIDFASDPTASFDRTSVAFHRWFGDATKDTFLVGWSKVDFIGSGPLQLDSEIWARFVDPVSGQPPATIFASQPFLFSEDVDGPWGESARADLGFELAGSGRYGLGAWQRNDAGSAIHNIMARAYAVTWNLGLPELQADLEVVVDSSSFSFGVSIGSHLSVAGALDSIDVFGGVSQKTWDIAYQYFFASPSPGDFDIRIQRVVTDNVAPPVTTLASSSLAAAVIGVDETSPDLSYLAPKSFDYSDARVLMAYARGGDIFGRLYDGNTALTSTFLIDSQPNTLFSPDVGAGAVGEFMVAYGHFNIDPALNQAFIRGARVLADGTVTAAQIGIDDVTPQAAGDPFLSSYPVGLGGGTPTNRMLASWTREGGSAQYRLLEPLGATSAYYGTGCPTPGGSVPVIGLSGGLPYLGNQDFGLTAKGGVPNQVAVMLMGGIDEVPYPGAPGCMLYVKGPFSFSFATTDASGDAALPLPMPFAPGIAGLGISCQWAFICPGCNPAGLVFSNVVDLYWND